MSRSKELVKNTAILTIGKMCTQFVSFLLLPLYTALLSTEEYGIVDLFTTYIALILPLVCWQLDQGIFRFMIDCREDETKTKAYFYGDTVARHKENRQIRKIFYLVVRANSIFFIWNIALGILKRDSIVTYVRKIFTGKSILKFLVLNESPLAGHLWYLGAILYVLVIVLLVDRFNCKKVLYYLTPVLLIADLVFGKYSLLIFHREFPYILVRNFLCVGIPYFCIGNLIREKRCSEKWNRKILQVLIVVFTITSLAERFVLVSAGLNATRDHYLSTTFLAICLFVYTLKSNWHNKGLAVIGRKCSTWLYIIHPIFITAFSVATGKLGIKSIYRCVAPIVTYCATLTFLIVMCRLKSLLVKNNQRK